MLALIFSHSCFIMPHQAGNPLTLSLFNANLLPIVETLKAKGIMPTSTPIAATEASPVPDPHPPTSVKRTASHDRLAPNDGLAPTNEQSPAADHTHVSRLTFSQHTALVL